MVASSAAVIAASAVMVSGSTGHAGCLPHWFVWVYVFELIAIGVCVFKALTV